MSEQQFISLEEERCLRAAVRQEQKEPPRPLMREPDPPKPFPDEALGEVLGPVARAIHDRVQAPLAICAQSVLAAATFALQGHADVVLPIGAGTQVRPISNFFCSVAESGERKSACDAEATRPIREYEAKLGEIYDPEHIAFRNELEAWEKAREEVKKKGKGNPKKIKEDLDRLGPEPPAPLLPLLLAPEPTFEGLCKHYLVGQPGLGLFSTEGGQFIAGHGMNQDNKLRTAAGLSNLWDGEPIRRVRAADGVLLLPGRRLTAHLMLQPQIGADLLGDGALEDQVLLSRVLLSAPATTAGTRMQRAEKPETNADLKRYFAVLTRILETPLPLAEGKRNELKPRRLSLGEEAKRLWLEFTDHIEKQIGPGGVLEPVRGLANKTPRACRSISGRVDANPRHRRRRDRRG